MTGAPTADPPRRRLLAGVAAAFAAAAVLLVVAVLPAEYGVDPTGLGAAVGFTRLAAGDDPQARPGDPGDASLARYVAEWTLRSRTVHEAGGATREFDETSVPFVVEVANLTRLTATLAWDAPGAEFEVSLRAPDGRRSQLVRSASGNASAEVVWRPVPWPNATEASVTFDARSEAATGEWRALVRLYDAGGAPAGEATPWTLRVDAQSYALEVTQETDLAEGDRVSIALRPGQDVEYKLHVAEGAAFSYRWSASGPVHVDLHGEPDADPETFTSYRLGRFDRDAGSLVAEFTGRHGWYFRNDGSAPVTIDLHTRGAYTIVGVV